MDTTDAVPDNGTTVDLFQLEGILVPVVFSIFFFVGIVGNATLIFIVLRNKPMRTKPNVFIVSLAIGDFLLILVSVPFVSIVYATHEWYFGDALCKINEFLQTLSLGVSIFTLTALSVDRFIAIVFPLASYSSSSLTRVIVASVFIWIVSIGLALMDLVVAHVSRCHQCGGNSTIVICNLYPEDWGEGYIRFRLVFRFIIFFAIPMIVIMSLYAIIAVVLLRQSETLSTTFTVRVPSSPGVGPASARRSSENAAILRQVESRKKIAKVVLSFVVIFVICWFPRHLYLMIFWLYPGFQMNMTWHVFKIIGYCLVFIYSSINPLALYLLNEEYRRYYHYYLFGCCYKPFRQKYSQRRGTRSDSTVMQTIIANSSSDDLLENNQKGCLTPEVSPNKSVKKLVSF